MDARTAKSRQPGLRFVLTAGILSVSLFGILRIPFVEQNFLLPFTKAQHGLACRIGGDPNAPISVGLSCSAADVIALCLGFILAFPVAWHKRLVGAVLGLVMIAAVNTVRIATLSHAVVNRQWFDLLHVYIWPGALLVVVSIFVFLWMSYSLRQPGSRSPLRSEGGWLSRPAVRFVLLTLLFVAVFIGTSKWWMHSSAVLMVSTWVAEVGAFVIRLFGSEAEVSRNIVRTASGGFVVTQECIMTPLIPAYFAAILALPLTRGQRLAGLLAAFPVFFLLGSARLLVLAFPTRLVGSHLVAIHGFYQFLLGALLIGLAAAFTTRTPRTLRKVAPRLLVATLAAAVTAIVVGLTYGRWLIAGTEWLRALLGHGGHQYIDPQGALVILTPYQIGLFLGLWLAWQPRASARRAGMGLAMLLLSQPLTLLLVGEWVTHTGVEPHVAAIRAWSVICVLLVGAWVLQGHRWLMKRRAVGAPEPQHG